MKTSPFFQKVILILRKLGILRYGVKKYRYTSGKDMPAKALMDDVYDEDKDLVSIQELKGVLKGKGFNSAQKTCSRCGTTLKTEGEPCPKCNNLKK